MERERVNARRVGVDIDLWREGGKIEGERKTSDVGAARKGDAGVGERTVHVCVHLPRNTWRYNDHDFFFCRSHLSLCFLSQ